MSKAAIQTISESRTERASDEGCINPFGNLLTQQDVRDLLKRVLGNDAELAEYSLRPYSAGKLGYLGSHHRLSVTARSRDDQRRTLSFFVKVVPYDVPSQAEYVIKKGVFLQEANFYDKIARELSSSYVGEPWSPVCYTVKKDLIIFEELGLKGYSLRGKLFDEQLVRAGLSSIARLHAASILAENRLGTSLKKLYPDAFKERGFDREGQTRKWFEIGVDVIIDVAERLGLDSGSIRAACEEVYRAMEASSTKVNVVSHGDLWANNLMFNEDVPPKCLLVDFQLIRYSPLAHDVAQFLYLCTNRKFRETHEQEMLKYYYTVLCETLDANQRSVRHPDWEEVVRGMEEQRFAAVITAAIFFPTVLMDEAVSAKVMSDPFKYSEFEFRDRRGVVRDVMEKDPEYAERMNETVVELVELAARLDELPKPC